MLVHNESSLLLRTGQGGVRLRTRQGVVRLPMCLGGARLPTCPDGACLWAHPDGSSSSEVSEQCLWPDGLAPDASGGFCLRTRPGGVFSITGRKWISNIILFPTSLFFSAEQF